MLRDGLMASAEDIVELLDEENYWPEEDLPELDDLGEIEDLDVLLGDVSFDLD